MVAYKTTPFLTLGIYLLHGDTHCYTDAPSGKFERIDFSPTVRCSILLCSPALICSPLPDLPFISTVHTSCDLSSLSSDGRSQDCNLSFLSVSIHGVGTLATVQLRHRVSVNELAIHRLYHSNMCNLFRLVLKCDCCEFCFPPILESTHLLPPHCHFR